MIGGHLSGNITQIDLSNAKTDFTKCEIKQEDMVLVAMPSFGGRAPAVAIAGMAIKKACSVRKENELFL